MHIAEGGSPRCRPASLGMFDSRGPTNVEELAHSIMSVVHYATCNWHSAFYGTTMSCHLQVGVTYIRDTNYLGNMALPREALSLNGI